MHSFPFILSISDKIGSLPYCHPQGCGENDFRKRRVAEFEPGDESVIDTWPLRLAAETRVEGFLMQLLHEEVL